MGEIKFKSFSSGSCGNCYYLGTADEGACPTGILIDAGVSLRRVRKELAAEGMSTDDFQSILITHDHYDHIRALGSYCKYLRKPVFSTDTLHRALSSNLFTKDYIAANRRVLQDGWNEVVPGQIRARYFVVPHDATQTVGYYIDFINYNFKFVIITDAGRITPEALEYAGCANAVVIESNYDSYMLEHGPYPKVLQDRIRDGHGHLSNAECAQAISSFVHPGLRNVFLCHLSENNNTPDAAHKSARNALDSAGRQDVRLVTLPRQLPSRLFTL